MRAGTGSTMSGLVRAPGTGSREPGATAPLSTNLNVNVKLGPMSPPSSPPSRRAAAAPATTAAAAAARRYKWIALSNITLGTLMVFINQSIVLIALPAIFRGIHLNPLTPANTGYMLWMLMGFMVVLAVLLVTLGRVGDMFGRVKMYNLGFAVFTAFSILLSVTWLHGPGAAIWLIAMRIGQGVGGAMLFANSSAIITDAFPRRPARPRARHQQRRRHRRSLHRTGPRRAAGAGPVAHGLPRVGALRDLRDGLGVPQARGPQRPHPGPHRLVGQRHLRAPG